MPSVAYAATATGTTPVCENGIQVTDISLCDSVPSTATYRLVKDGTGIDKLWMYVADCEPNPEQQAKFDQRNGVDYVESVLHTDTRPSNPLTSDEIVARAQNLTQGCNTIKQAYQDKQCCDS